MKPTDFAIRLSAFFRDYLPAQRNVSPNTVRNHTRSIFRKLGVHTRLEAAALAARHGFPVHPRARSTGR